MRLNLYLEIDITYKIFCFPYPVFPSFFSAFFLMDPVNTEGTVVAPKEICLRSSLTDGSGFLSGGLRLLTSAS